MACPFENSNECTHRRTLTRRFLKQWIGPRSEPYLVLVYVKEEFCQEVYQVLRILLVYGVAFHDSVQLLQADPFLRSASQMQLL